MRKAKLIKKDSIEAPRPVSKPLRAPLVEVAGLRREVALRMAPMDSRRLRERARRLLGL